MFKSISESIHNFLKSWWRPITCVWLSGTVFVNGIYLPIKLGEFPDLMALGALITAVVAAFAVREYGKIKGTAE